MEPDHEYGHLVGQRGEAGQMLDASQTFIALYLARDCQDPRLHAWSSSLHHSHETAIPSAAEKS